MKKSAATSDLRWRISMGLGGLIFLFGGSQHPSGPNDQGLRIELATMMEDDAWYVSHALILAGAILISAGLYQAWRRGVWQPHGAASRLATIAWALFAAESFFHLISAVDADRLRAEETAPIAYIHLGLAVVIYPLTGLAIIWLARQQMRLWPVAARVFAGAAIVGGVAMALSVPLAVASDTNTDVFFMLGGILPALWAITCGITGEREVVVASVERSSMAVSS